MSSLLLGIIFGVVLGQVFNPVLYPGPRAATLSFAIRISILTVTLALGICIGLFGAQFLSASTIAPPP